MTNKHRKRYLNYPTKKSILTLSSNKEMSTSQNCEVNIRNIFKSQIIPPQILDKLNKKIKNKYLIT